jgi:stage II sporulation protein GA (sporulation sigma-E factor processing peptidase)
MDFALLVITGWVLRTKMRIWRYGIGAGIGAIFAFGNAYEGWSGIWFVLIKWLVVVGIVGAAFGWQGFTSLIKQSGVFLMGSFLMAGGVQGVQQLFAISSEVATVGIVAMLLIGVPLLFAVRQLLVGLRKQAVVGRSCMPVDIRIEGVTRTLMGFMDTGNHLYEPMTGLPVIIGMVETWRGLLPEKVIEAIHEGDLTRISTLPIARKLRIVPYRSVGTGTRWLMGIRPDWVRIGEHTYTQVILALQGDVIHKHGAYEVILHPELS